jgi:peptide/nickel transport system permease protein
MAIAPIATVPDSRGPGAMWRSAWQVGKATDVLGRLAIGIFLLLTVLLAFMPLLVPHNPTAIVGVPFRPPSREFLFGLDNNGRDVFSRVLVGMRTSWFSAFAVIAAGAIVGGAIGLTAGISGGWLDSVLMRFTEVFLALPSTLIALAVAVGLGSSLRNTLFAIAIVWWPFYARVVRGEARALMVRPHVEAARMGGCSRWTIAVRHVMPGVLGSVLVIATLDIGNVLLLLSGLSFLGLGSPPPAAELGEMTAQGMPYLLTNWWIPVWPAAAIFLLTLIGNLAGDGMRDLAGA